MNNKLTIWLLQTGEPLHLDSGNPRPMRAMNLANALVAAGHNVVVWSSSFYHQEKRHRVQGNARVKVSESLEIRLVKSPGYKRNIGVGRLWDHAVLASNLSKQLSVETTLPDVAFVGYPPIETAAVMTKWLAAREVPCMVDVKDQWPLVFTNSLPEFLKPVGRIALSAYFYYGHRALRDATAISAMADGFLKWAADFAGRPVSVLDRVVPLTVDTGKTDLSDLKDAGRWWDRQGIYDDGTQRICFIGSHSTAFDMEPVLQTARLLDSAGNPFQFVICGDGEKSAIWKQKFKGLSNVYFPGWIDRSKIEALAKRSSAALAPYHSSDDFVQSIPNKVIDSLALGLPILSPLRGEVRNLIAQHNIGLSYGAIVGKTLESCIQDLTEMPEFQRKLSENARKLFQEMFSFQKVYGGLVRHLELLAKKGR